MIGKIKQVNWWIPAIIFYGIGDLVTTIYGLEYGGLYEKNPNALFIIENWGYLGLIFVKLCVIATLFEFTNLFSKWFNWYNIAIPLVITLLGIVVTGWNSYLIIAV